MRKCVLCKRKKIQGNGTFFNVPKDENRRRKWSEICQMQFAPNDCICDDHFQTSQIIRAGRKTLLMPNADPFVIVIDVTSSSGLHYSAQKKDPLPLKETSQNNACNTFPMKLKNKIFNEHQDVKTESKATVVTSVDPHDIYESLKEVLGENLCKINKDLEDQENRLKYSYVKSESRTISTQTNSRICGTVQVSEFADDYRFNCFYCSETFALENWIKFIRHLKKRHFDYEEAFKISEYVSDHDYTPINVHQSISDSITQALHVETVLVDPNLILPCLVEPIEFSYNFFDSMVLKPNYTTEEYMKVSNDHEILNTFVNSERSSIVMPMENKLYDSINIVKNEPAVSPLPQTSTIEKSKPLKKRALKQTSKKGTRTTEKSKQKVSSSGVLYLKNSIKQSSNKTALSRCLKRSNTIETIKPEGDKQLTASESFQQNATELTFEYTPRDIIDCLLDSMKNYPVLWEFDEQPFNENYYEAIEELCRTINIKWSLNIDTLKMRRTVNRILSFYCSVYPCDNIEDMNPYTNYYDKCAAFLPASVHDIAYARCSHCYRCFKCNSELRFHLLQEQKCLQWPFRCVQCKECFRYMDEYELHKLLPHHQEVFRCQQCNRKFIQRNKYNTHVATHEIKASDEPGKHICDVCGKVFKIKGELQAHKVYHGERKHKCNLCPKSFYTNAKLRNHGKTHTKQYDIVCEVCGKGCFDHARLRQHMLRHTGAKVTCNICNLELRRSSLNRHLRLVHVAYEGTIETTHRAKCHHYKSLFVTKKRSKYRSKNKNYYCKICNIRFDGQKQITEHNKEHHSDSPRWSCKMCTSEFTKKMNLKGHYRRKHNLHIYQAFKLIDQNEDLEAVLAIKTEELDKLGETLGYSQNGASNAEKPLEAGVIKLEQSSNEIFIEEEQMHSCEIQAEIMKVSDNLTTVPGEVEIDDDDFFANLLK